MIHLFLSSTPSLIHTLGWTLFHFCWQGAIIALLLWCILNLLNGHPPQLRYSAACGALVLMVLFPILTFARIAASQDTTYTSRISPTAWNPALNLGSGFGSPTASWLDRLAQSLDHAMSWILSVWLAGVLIFIFRLNIGFYVARRMKYVATLPIPAELQILFNELKLRLGINRSIRFIGSTVVQVPSVVGWLRPVVLMPLGCVTGLSTIQIEAILVHELAHIRRHDYLVSVFQSMVEAVLFYHPAVWWVSKQLRKEREYCCDDLAVRIGKDSFAYAKALSLLEENRSSAYFTALGANGGVLTMRIKRLLGYEENPAVSRLASLALLAVIVLAGGLWIGAIAHAQSETAHINPLLKQSPEVHTRSALATEYQNWLDQDVVWIITPQESEAFSHLTNNEERDQFISQFWIRRNAPGSAPDSYRTEHYQRIAYANQHFTFEQSPGWKTDRGHIYIAYGKPDMIDAHPRGNDYSSGKPIELWHYALLESVGKNVDLKFIDVCSCGDYRLQPLQGISLPQPSKPGIPGGADKPK